MSNDCYNTFCPVAKACEVIEPRWTLLILCELWQGSTRFNEIRRGVPGISPTLLSKRLKEMEKHGLLHRLQAEASGEIGYATTPMANELQPIVHAFGKWAHHNIDSEITLEHLDAKLLMWNMRRRINPQALPKGRVTVIQFTFPELPEDQRNYWLISKPGQPVDLCLLDPSHDVDLFIRADLKAMTSAWMGWSGLRQEITAGKIMPIGSSPLVASLEKWLVCSSYAQEAQAQAAA